MYEQDDIPVVKRILLIVLWAIVAVAVLWTLVWFVFFRGNGKKAPATHKATQQSQAAPKSQKSSPAATDSGSGGASETQTGQNPAPATGTTPSELANTGAGDVVTPVVVAAVAGSTVYYIRTRKRLLAS